MNKKEINNGYCLNCGKKSIKPFCDRKCYLGYVRKGEPGTAAKRSEEKRRKELPDSIIKKEIYIGSKSIIKYNQITPEMIVAKRKNILAYRQRRKKIRTNPPEPKKGKRICMVCGNTYHGINAKYLLCSRECRIINGRNQYYLNRDVILANGRLKYKNNWWQPEPFECKECGKIHQPRYGDKHDKYCSNSCANKNIRSNQRHKRRIYIGKEFIKLSVTKIYQRDGWRCHICGKKVNKDLKSPHLMSATLDHIIPLAKGGTHEPRNVRLAHMICNSIKRDQVSVNGDQLLLFG